MSELELLRVLLLVSMAVGPYGTFRFFSEPSRARLVVHGSALTCGAAGLFTSLSFLSGGWLLFCAGSLALFLLRRLREDGAKLLRAPQRLVVTVPLLFSNIAAVWLVAGTNDLRLLDYGPEFSFYAALHGNVLGWMVVGAMAGLAEEARSYRTLHTASVLVSFVSFLLIAVGIDQWRSLKPIGVVGLSVAIPASLLAFLHTVMRRPQRGALALGVASFAGLLLTMLLAWQYELSRLTFPPVLNVRSMVSVHGVLNTVVVGPCFLLAVALAAHRDTTTRAESPSS